MSTAYYAVFHALAELCTGELLGVRADKRSEDYVRVYRSLEHGTLKSAFRTAPLNANDALRKIGDRVVRLQSERIRSDYVPSQALYTLDECRDLVRSADSVVRSIGTLSREERKRLAVHLLFKNRP